jgi:hypothetical protein
MPIDADKYRAVIQAELKLITDRVLRGGCETYADYTKCVGQIQAYNGALAKFKETLKADDDD